MLSDREVYGWGLLDLYAQSTPIAAHVIQTQITRNSKAVCPLMPLNTAPGRTVKNILAASSASLSVTCLEWLQRPMPQRLQEQPLYLSKPVLQDEADMLLEDHKRHEPEHARKNLDQKDPGSGDGNNALAVKVPGHAGPGHFDAPGSQVASIALQDALQISPDELERLDRKQLQELVLQLQRLSPTKGGWRIKVVQGSTGQRKNAGMPPGPGDMERSSSRHARQQLEFKYRSDESQMTALNAKVRSWNSNHTARLQPSAKKRRAMDKQHELDARGGSSLLRDATPQRCCTAASFSASTRTASRMGSVATSMRGTRARP